METNVCLIGAGPSGLEMMQHMNKLNVNQICQERNEEIGGIWQYTGESGKRKRIIQKYIHLCMIIYILMDLQKHQNFLIIFLTEEMTSQPKRKQFYEFLKSFTNKFNLKEKIKFNIWVESVTQKDNLFTVKTVDLNNHKQGDKNIPIMTNIFTHVIVATGHFNQPNIYTFPGEETFTGEILHSKYFISAKKFKDKRVLIIGGSYSAEDVAANCWKFGAKNIVISVRSGSMGLKWPNSIEEKPDSILTNINKDLVTFKDGTSKSFDVIIKCIGFKHQFPFMDEELTLVSQNNMQPNLQNGVVFPDNNKLQYMGMQDQWQTFSMFNAQAEYISFLLTNKLNLPNIDIQTKEIKEWIKLMNKADNGDCHDKINFQADYVNYLTKLVDGPNVDTRHLFHDWENNRQEDIITHRDKTHKSIFTGKLAHAPQMSWADDQVD